MKIVRTRNEMSEMQLHNPIGFIPTMGALHDGHMSLVKASKDKGLFTVVSVFVNPTQFNNPEDFEKYPIDTQSDIRKLESAGCDILFLPNKEEIYNEKSLSVNYIHDFGSLENIYEGAFRPGHFRGVGQVVHILFEIVRPDFAFFGEKDFQQLAVIKHLVKMIGMQTQIIGMPTIREKDGLAMSSRNRRLNQTERRQALVLYQALSLVKEMRLVSTRDIILKAVTELFNNQSGVRLEYFDIIHEEDFTSAEVLQGQNLRSIIAAYVGNVRLIDNMKA